MTAHQSKRKVAAPEVSVVDMAALAAATGRFRALTLYIDSPDTVRAARDMTRATLDDWRLDRLVDDVQLVVSELVGNVVTHAVPDDCLSQPGGARRVDVVYKMWPKWLFVGVVDEDSTPPDLPVGGLLCPELAPDFSEAVLPDTGRGLLIVQRLADAVWWTRGEPGGKTVWARFDLDGASADSSP
ncbi:ATP-binding protein [Streptomyces sp. BR1]|uniref:ATP-binding protein n=1 Tax=Streptomyces sp. BR1 TaxID=1592323 RepID=UPI00402BD49E